MTGRIRKITLFPATLFPYRTESDCISLWQERPARKLSISSPFRMVNEASREKTWELLPKKMIVLAGYESTGKRSLLWHKLILSIPGHALDMSSSSVLAREENMFKRRVRQAIEIFCRAPTLSSCGHAGNTSSRFRIHRVFRPYVERTYVMIT